MIQNKGKEGFFISIEGIDGTGKSTQIERIARYLEKHKIEGIFTREPGGTEIGEKIRDILLDAKNTEMLSLTEIMLYAASRAQLVREVIKPAIKSGKCVICDRFIDSSIAYQGFGRNMRKAVEDINQYSLDGIIPDLTILLDIGTQAAEERMRSRNTIAETSHPLELDRLESEGNTFKIAVANGYRQLAKENPDRIKVIDSLGTPDEVSREISAELDRLFYKKEN